MAIVSLHFQQLHLTPAMSAFRTLRLGKYHSNGLQRNSVPARAGSHFLPFPGFSAPEEIVFFANLEAKTLLYLWRFLLSPVMARCHCPEGSSRWEPGLRHQRFKQAERLSLIFASGAHNRKMEQAGNWFSIKESSFSLAQFHVQPLINIYCSHRSP